MIPKGCKLDGALYYMIAARCKDGNVCNDCNYSKIECEHSNKVSIGCSTYIVVDLNDGESLPKAKAWCKECKKESSAPIAKTIMNGKKAYIMECKICKSKYVMYKSDYLVKYTGFTNGKGDFVPPSKENRFELPQYLKKKYEKESFKRKIELWKNFGYSEQEAIERIEKLDKEKKERTKKFEKEFNIKMENIKNEREKDLINKKSEERKKLIQQGLLVYNKKCGCLINKETGEVYKY